MTTGTWDYAATHDGSSPGTLGSGGEPLASAHTLVIANVDRDGNDLHDALLTTSHLHVEAGAAWANFQVTSARDAAGAAAVTMTVLPLDHDGDIDAGWVEGTLILLPVSTDACAWPVSYSGCNDCEPLRAAGVRRIEYEQMAGDLLGRWTGGVFGSCEVTVRPCRAECLDRTSTWWGRGPFPWGSAGGWIPYLWNGQWYNMRCGTCHQSGCSCAAGDAIKLPGPVQSVTSIRIDGVVLDPSAYRIDNGYLLVRTDGGMWPTCQNLDALADQPDTFEVVYVKGVPVPIGGQVAAGILACELAKAACGDQSCGLPQRVQSISRQGVTVAVLDSFDDVEKGRTGIWLIDSWVASIVGTKRRSRVYSPDIPRPRTRHTTWRG